MPLNMDCLRPVAVCLFLATLGLSACTQESASPEAAAEADDRAATGSVATETAAAQDNSETVYRIDGASSKIYWRVYKAGAFARFGHNHIISVPAPAGEIVLRPTLSESAVEIDFVVDELVIDDPELRDLYGEDFESVPTDEDIEGTKGNMLSENVLNGANFPRIKVTATGLSQIGPGQSIDLRIEMLGRVINVEAPIDISVDDTAIMASGEFRLTHEALGMVPFSVMMGALQVGENLDFTYEIHAEK